MPNNRPFTILSYWDRGIPKFIVWSTIGQGIPDNGPSISIRNGKLRVTLIKDQKFELQLPELNPGEEVPVEIEVIDPETRLSEISEIAWKAGQSSQEEDSS